MSRRRLAMVLLALGACTEVGPSTSPYAHESPPIPPPPLQSLSRSRFLGGSGLDVIDDVAKANDDVVYVVGGTASPDFPFTDGTFLDPTAPAGCSACPFDGFVAAMGPDGELIWATRIGSPGHDRITALAVAGQDVFVAGITGERAGLAGWHGGADPAGERGEQDGLVCRLDTATGAIEACRNLGGSGATGVTDLAVNQSAFRVDVVMISPAGEDLHLDPDYQAAFAGRHRATPAGADVVVMSLTTSLEQNGNPVWASYLGGTGDERGTPALTIDATGNTTTPIVVLAETASTDAATPNGFLATAPADGNNAYLAQLTSDGITLQYATYVGGNGDDRVGPNSLLDLGNDVFVGITTRSTDLPTTDFAQQRNHGGNGGVGCGDGDVWIGRFATAAMNANSLLGATYLGGAQGEQLGGISLSSFQQFNTAVMVTGLTHSTDFPVQNAAQPLFSSTPCAQQPGSADVFVTNLAWLLDITDSTYLGGSNVDQGTAVARGFGDRTVVAGVTGSSNFPLRLSVDPTNDGMGDGFIAEYGMLPFIPPGPDIDRDGGGFDDDGGVPAGPDTDGPYEEDGAFCVCGAGGSPAAGVGPLLLVIAGVVLRRKRRSV